MRLSHIVEHAVDTMLRGNLELSGNMIFNKLGEKLTVFVLKHIVKSYAAAHKNLFNTRNFTQAPKQRQIL